MQTVLKINNANEKLFQIENNFKLTKCLNSGDPS